MAGRTPNFGLNTFGGNQPGSIADDGGKYTGGDRLLMDKLFAALAANDGHVHAASTDIPTDAPDPTLLTDSGTLPAGQDFFYEVTFVTTDGLETLAGDEVSQSTPDILPQPAPVSAETSTDGSNHLPSGIWYYAITGLRGAEESILSPAFSVTVLDGEDTATLTLPALGDATSYRIWRMGLNESGYTKLGTSATTTFVDDGSIPSNPCPTDPSNQPPQANSGINRYGIQLDLSTADAAIINDGHFRSWRIYRTDVSGQYTSVSLVHEVVETVDELDPDSGLVTSWIDAGDDLLDGTPPLVSESLSLVPYSVEKFATEPDPAGYPEGYPILVGTGPYVLELLQDGAWTAVGGGGGAIPPAVVAWGSDWAVTPPCLGNTTPVWLLPMADASRNRDLGDQSNDVIWVANGAFVNLLTTQVGTMTFHVDVGVDVSGMTAGDVIELGQDNSQSNWPHQNNFHVVTAGEIAGTQPLQLSYEYTEAVYDDLFTSAPWLQAPTTCLITYVQWYASISGDGTVFDPTAVHIRDFPLLAPTYSDDGTDATVTWDTGSAPGGITPTEHVVFYFMDLNGNGPDGDNPSVAWNAGTTAPFALPTDPGGYVLFVDGPPHSGRSWQSQPITTILVS